MSKCQFVKKNRVYVKSIGGIAIDESEYDSPEGVLVDYGEVSCPYVADAGEKFCPRHKLEMDLATRP